MCHGGKLALRDDGVRDEALARRAVLWKLPAAFRSGVLPARVWSRKVAISIASLAPAEALWRDAG